MGNESHSINPQQPIPIPQQLKRIIIEKISLGEYIPGEKIPAERALSETYGISRISAREALTELIAENYLFRIPGKGTFAERAEQVARKLKVSLRERGVGTVFVGADASLPKGHNQSLSALKQNWGEKAFNTYISTFAVTRGIEPPRRGS